MAEEALAGGRPSPYEAQIHALLQAETDIAERTESIPRSSLFARSPQQDGSAPSPLDDQARLARALEESTRDAAAAATQNRVADDEERLRLALALSTAAAAPPPPAAAPTDEQRLAAAMAASEQSFEAQRSSMLDTVLGVLRACSPIIASYIDEHCGLFVESGGGASTAAGAAEIEVFCDFRCALPSHLVASHLVPSRRIASHLVSYQLISFFASSAALLRAPPSTASAATH
jgi:hypothetical protein